VQPLQHLQQPAFLGRRTVPEKLGVEVNRISRLRHSCQLAHLQTTLHGITEAGPFLACQPYVCAASHGITETEPVLACQPYAVLHRTASLKQDPFSLPT